MQVSNPITSEMQPGSLLKNTIESSESGDLELAWSHSFVVLESGAEGDG